MARAGELRSGGRRLPIAELADRMAFLRGHLADDKVPRRVEADSGKVFERKLRAPYWMAAGRAV